MGKKKKRTSRKRRKAMAARARAGRDTKEPREARDAADADEELSDDEDGEPPDPADGDSSEPDEDEDDPSADEDEEPDSDAAPSSDEPSSRPSDAPERPPWVERIVAFERRWSRLESWLLFIALMVLMAVLCIWISLNGMSSPLATPNKAGIVFRALLGAVLLGGAARFALRKREMPRWQRSVATAVGVVVGCALAPLWRGVGIETFGGLLDWA
ncbi:MAG: hypothetical protein JRI23_17865, partial [Deltaproteobacteria bacterium]|nr:hypothetical protein [Deltaproteobacteria bacterium]MBW2533700.1 hypothetical protein [Deltaproteobacteria bacterium]